MVTNRCVSPEAIENEKRAKFRYAKSFEGRIHTFYTCMKRRVNGKGCSCPHLYIGKELCSQKEFLEFARKNKTLKLLYDNWAKSNYSYTITPTVNRIDSNKGYTLDNIEFVTFSDNTRFSNPNPYRDNKGRYASS